MHMYLLRHFPKTGRCDECGATGKTHHALIHGHEYSYDREDYRELCPRCHLTYDGKLGKSGEANPNAKLTEAIVLEARARHAAGRVSIKVLAREYGVSQRVMSKALSGRLWACVEGLEYVPVQCHGETHHQAKLTDAMVREARVRHAAGESGLLACQGIRRV